MITGNTRLTRKDRQQIIDQFMRETGSRIFSPPLFLAWLEPQTGHPAWRIFFGLGDDEAALQYRLGLVRRWTASLRLEIRIRPIDAAAAAIDAQSTSVIGFPRFLSPVEARNHGGAYHRFDPHSRDDMRELLRQAGTGLAAWFNRYGGALHMAGLEREIILDQIAAIQAIALEPDSIGGESGAA